MRTTSTRRASFFANTLGLLLLLTGCNQAPQVSDGVLDIRGGGEFSGQLVAEDASNDTLTFEVTAFPDQGTLTLTDSAGLFQFTPDPGQTEAVEFSFSATDGELVSKTATVVIQFSDNSLTGQVSGLGSAAGQVVASSDGGVHTASIGAGGSFAFGDLPAASYSIKVILPGHDTGDAIAVNATSSLTWDSDVGGAAALPTLDFEAVELASDPFVFHWHEDASMGGTEYSAHVNSPVVVEFLEEEVAVGDAAAAHKLHHDYNVILSDEAEAWTQEHAFRFLETLRMIPQDVRNSYSEQTLAASKWILADEFIDNDIEVVVSGSLSVVRLSSAVFDHATPRLVTVEGKRGRFYSKRLHHALVRFVTQGGEDIDAVEQILGERFGVSTLIPDYGTLTASTTAETAGRFQAFHPSELVEIINQFEEMPPGMHKINGMNYLVRRLDGTPHPFYNAPAVAWPQVGYIEFMDIAFTSTSVEHMHRLMIHEKAHFLWALSFSQTIRDEWIELGGWYPNADDPDGWSTSFQTEFVSAYAHHKNPNEDMAETLSYFIMNPDKLRSRSMRKYEFVRDYIMQGSLYISVIREDLTFEVFNLYPDYVFPGKIKRVDIEVAGAAQEDKVATVEIEIYDLGEASGGAAYAFLRILSEVGTLKDLYLYPVSESRTVLRGSFDLSRYAKHGLWITDQIVITDAVGNQRFEGVDDFGWKLFVDNPLEDLDPPAYVLDTASLSQATDLVSFVAPVNIVTAEWEVTENQAMGPNGPCYATLRHEGSQTYAFEQYGLFDAVSSTCSIEWILTNYHHSGVYKMNYLWMRDEALNVGSYYFTEQEGEEVARTITVTTTDPDGEAPELDLNNITISGVPSNPESPNGETLVSLSYYARDDKSGLDRVSYNLRDPQGINHQQYHYHENFYTVFFEGDPTAWTLYEVNVLLPVGSAPGLWGLSSMYLADKAGNFDQIDFTETLHFDVD